MMDFIEPGKKFGLVTIAHRAEKGDHSRRNIVVLRLRMREGALAAVKQHSTVPAQNAFILS